MLSADSVQRALNGGGGLNASAGLVLPTSRPAWLRWGGRWPLALCLLTCFLALLGLGALVAFHPPPRRVPLLTSVLVLMVTMSRLRQVRPVDVLAVSGVRIASALLVATVVTRWVFPGLYGYPTVLHSLRIVGVYEVGQLALALLLLLGLDPEVRTSLRSPFSRGRSVVITGVVMSLALLAAGAWTGHYLVSGAQPYLPAGYFKIFVTSASPGGAGPSFSSCPNEPNTLPLPDATQVRLGRGHDARGCGFRYAVSADPSGLICLERDYSNGGTDLLQCVSRLTGPQRVLVMPFDELCHADCPRRHFGFTVPGTREVQVVYSGGRRFHLRVRRLTDPNFRKAGAAGYVSWTAPVSSSLANAPIYRGVGPDGRVLWTTDKRGDLRGSATHDVCGCP